MPDDVAHGRAPTADDQRWLAAGEQLRPHLSLVRAADGARYVVSTVVLVGTLVAGLGVFALDAASSRAVLVPGGLSLLASTAAVVVALSAVVSRSRRLAPEDLVAVKAFYQAELGRTRRAGKAGVLLVASVILAAVAGTVTLVGRATAGPSLSATLVAVTGRAATAEATLRDGRAEDRAEITIRCDGAVAAVAYGVAGSDGTVTMHATTPDLVHAAGCTALVVVRRGGHHRRGATAPPPLTGAGASPPGVASACMRSANTTDALPAQTGRAGGGAHGRPRPGPRPRSAG